MGEIADALKRANAARDKQAASARRERRPGSTAGIDSFVPPPQPSPPVVREHNYTDALELSDSFGPLHEAPEREVELELSGGPGPHSSARAVLAQHHHGTAEAFRHFALRVSREAELLGNRSVLIVSALRGEGKTTTACNLSLALATMAGEKPTALVDLDLRRPALGRYLGSTSAVGIDAVLRGKSDLDRARVATNLPYLDIFPVVRPVPNPHELLAADVLPDVLSMLRSRYHMIIIDTPPVLLVPDVELMLPYAGACVAVARSRMTRVDAFSQLVAMLPKEKFLGTFLNESRRRRDRKYVDYYLDEEEGEFETA